MLSCVSVLDARIELICCKEAPAADVELVSQVGTGVVTRWMSPLTRMLP